MLCRAVYIALILASCASHSAAENRSDSIRAPDPEEIFEAYQQGFIDYRDYQELLEIIRHEFLSAEDSLFLMHFPDLLTGQSSHPLVETADIPVPIEPASTDTGRYLRRHAALFRQYHRLENSAGRRRLYRFQGEYLSVLVYGEYEREYSGRQNWYRRSLTYRIGADEDNTHTFVLGNFKERFGLGLIYGYHGRLVSISETMSGSERFLYPDYGGSNGVYFEANRRTDRIRVVFNTDRDDGFETQLTAASAGRRMGRWKLALSAGRGEISNRMAGVSTRFTIFSLSTEVDGNGYTFAGEFAASENGNQWPVAVAVQSRMRRGRTRVGFDAWSYDRAYPSFFSGGPSSRRSRTVEVDEIGYSYSDRYRGERGIIINTGYPLIRGSTAHSSIMYASREFNDDRAEIRIGIERAVGSGFTFEIDGYWCGDDFYSGKTMRRSFQVELVHTAGDARNRLVVGRRFDSGPNRADYLAVLSSRMRGLWGAASAVIKFDRVSPETMDSLYLYATAQYELRLGRYISTYVKYSHRYRRNEPGESYGIFRWDVRWVMQ